MIRKSIATAAMIVAFALAPVGAAYATPDTGSGGASIESGDGPRTAGAEIGSIGTGSGGAPIGSVGTGSPDYSQPSPKPSRDDYDTPEAYGTAVSLWEAGERARVANLEASKGLDGSPDICSDDRTSANYCPVAGDEK